MKKGRPFTPSLSSPDAGEDEEGGAQGIKMTSMVPRIVFSKEREDTKSTSRILVVSKRERKYGGSNESNNQNRKSINR
jgi:hypothetical protein